MQFQRLQDFSKLLSCSDVAEKYEVSRATVLLHCKSGKIKGCARTRHGYLIDPEEPRALLARALQIEKQHPGCKVGKGAAYRKNNFLDIFIISVPWKIYKRLAGFIP